MDIGHSKIFVTKKKSKKLWSDNGTNLKSAYRKLLDALEDLNQDRIKDEMTNCKIDWHFIVPASPHVGG